LLTRTITRRARVALAAMALLISGAAVAQQSEPDVEKVVKDYLLSQARRGEVEAVVAAYLEKHPEAVEKIIVDYLTKHPEVLESGIDAYVQKRRPKTANAPPQPQADNSAAIKQNASLLLNSSHQVTIGNTSGDVTLVEFFDYNCGFCKRALGDLMQVMRDDPKLRIVLKEMPILGPGSAEAAEVAVAVRMQDPDGQKYLAFHQKLLGARGQANRETALAAAQDAGVDMARLEQDMAGSEVHETIEENLRLAHDLGIHGTPGYVVGNSVISGAVGVAALREKIEIARK
jgi:protein-disulfide isomerase